MITAKSLINNLTKNEIEAYYKTHTTKNTAEYFGTCTKTLNKVFDYFNIEHHSRALDIKLGCNEKYGVDNVFQLDSVKDQSKQTKLTNYGSETFNNREQATKTSNAIYGQGNYNNRKKAFNTYKNNTGLDNPFQDIDNINNNIIKKYGDLETFYSIREQIIIQSLEDKYNISNVSQLPDIARKKVITAKRAVALDGTVFDSNWEVKVYDYCIDHLIDIERNISLEYEYNGKNKITFIDFKIDNKLVEVKGNHLLDGCFDYKMSVPIEVKLDLYRKNNVYIVTDIIHLKNKDKFKGINLIDIHNFD